MEKKVMRRSGTEFPPPRGVPPGSQNGQKGGAPKGYGVSPSPRSAPGVRGEANRWCVVGVPSIPLPAVRCRVLTAGIQDFRTVSTSSN